MAFFTVHHFCSVTAPKWVAAPLVDPLHPLLWCPDHDHAGQLDLGLLGWHQGDGDTGRDGDSGARATPPSQGTQAPLHMCEGRHTSADRHKRVLRGGQTVHTALRVRARGPHWGRVMGTRPGVFGQLRRLTHPNSLPIPG